MSPGTAYSAICRRHVTETLRPVRHFKSSSSNGRYVKGLHHISVGLLLILLIGTSPAKWTASAGGEATAGHLLNLVNGHTGAAFFALPVMPDTAGVESGPDGATTFRAATHEPAAGHAFDVRGGADVLRDGGCRTHILNRVLRI